ncbi:MAG: decaprenyl-phosphate phosphoribosyltransferase [Planctomycetes bacterium]|nr:decaprenyl-phosphate phosphoribosyltransferase [Planctomycetota bacterium]
MMPVQLEALRPHQWVKNLLVFAPLLFATTGPRGQETNTFFVPGAWQAAGWAFAVFSLAASSIYLLNDIVDREADARHPKKRSRPIASGRLSVGAAWTLLAIVLVACAAAAMLVPTAAGSAPFLVWPAAYLALNVAYSFFLKALVVVDCMCIALGFQLRVMAGAAAVQVEASHWLLLCTFFFSLFLAFCKRYEEVGRKAEVEGLTRATMEHYSLAFLNMMIGPMAALSILSYALYTVSPETVARHGSDRLMYTVPIVVYGVFRYLFLVYRKSEGGDPARLLFRDLPLVLSGLFYALAVVALLRLVPTPA